MPAAIRRSIWGATAALLLWASLAVPAGAAADAPPAAVMAVVDPGPGDDLVVTTGFYLDPADSEPTMIVRLSGDPATLPDGSRVAVQIGDPEGQRMRASLVMVGGVPVGVLEQGDGIDWEQVGEVSASFTADGDAAIGVPELSGEVAWVEITTPGNAPAVSPFFPFDALSASGSPGVIRTSRFGLAVSPGEVGGAVARVDSQPQIEVANETITVSSDQRPPADALGLPVVSTVDFVRLSPGDPADGRVPFFVLIDHAAATVTLWDSSGDIPVLVDVPDDDWLVKGLDSDGQVALDGTIFSVTLDLEGLLAATGIADDPSAVEVGLRRVLTLEDGRRVTSDGVLGTLDWYEGSVGATPSPSAETGASLPDVGGDTPVTLTPVSADDGGTNTAVVLIAALLAAGLAVAALATARASRRRAEIASDPALGAMAKVVSGADDPADGDKARVSVGARAVKVPDGETPPDGATTGVGVAGARAAASREALARRDGDTTKAPKGAPPGKDAMWTAMRKRADETPATVSGEESMTDGDAADSDKPDESKAGPGKPGGDKAEPDKAESDKAEPDKPESDKAEPDKPDGDKAEPDKPDGDKAEPDKAESDKAEPDKAEPDKSGGDKADSDKPDEGKAGSGRPDGDKAGSKTSPAAEVETSQGDAPPDSAGAGEGRDNSTRSAAVAPDDALDALNQLIDDLPLPPES